MAHPDDAANATQECGAAALVTKGMGPGRMGRGGLALLPGDRKRAGGGGVGLERSRLRRTTYPGTATWSVCWLLRAREEARGRRDERRGARLLRTSLRRSQRAQARGREQNAHTTPQAHSDLISARWWIWKQHRRAWLRLVDFKPDPRWNFFWEVRSGSEMASPNNGRVLYFRIGLLVMMMMMVGRSGAADDMMMMN